MACGTAEGKVFLFTRKDDQWTKSEFSAHQEGVNGLSWGPSTEPAMLSRDNKKFVLPPKRICTGGIDKFVKVWTFENDSQLPKEEKIGTHDNWVRDVAWCTNIGVQNEMIASVSEDMTCRVWKRTDKAWIEKRITFSQNVPLWKCSWSQVGNMLAVSGGDNQVHIMSEETNGDWKEIKLVNEESAAK